MDALGHMTLPLLKGHLRVNDAPSLNGRPRATDAPPLNGRPRALTKKAPRAPTQFIWKTSTPHTFNLRSGKMSNQPTFDAMAFVAMVRTLDKLQVTLAVGALSKAPEAEAMMRQIQSSNETRDRRA